MIVIAYGTDFVKNTYDALTASDIKSSLKAGFSVSIKPNLVVSRPANDGATTHPEVVEGIILYLKDYGVRDIKIIESSWVGESTKRAFKNCGYEELSRKHNVPLIDLKNDSHTTFSRDGYRISICDQAINTDFLINVPVLKAHCQTRLTCCMKNLKGCIPDSEKRRFHSLGIHKPVAALNMIIKTGYCVVDGICGDLSFEEGGTPVQANRIISGRDPLMIDSFCAELIGYRPDEIEYISYGKEMGLGELFSDSTPLLELNTQDEHAREIKSGQISNRRANKNAGGHSNKYSGLIEEDAACSACYSSLIFALHRSGGKLRGHTLGKIKIGQGFKGKTGNGMEIGIGNCANGFDKYVPGCPPKATDIVNALKLLR